MNKDDTYYFHQTPSQLAKDLIPFVPLEPTDILLEPFKGEGAFYNNFPEANPKDWCEITEGRDYKDHAQPYDWVISNPPFRLEEGAGRVNAFWFLVDYYTQHARKGVAFLGNDSCFSTLTPRRLQILRERGWSVNKVVVCSIKKWRGRYFFIILQKQSNNFYNHLVSNYEWVCVLSSR